MKGVNKICIIVLPISNDAQALNLSYLIALLDLISFTILRMYIYFLRLKLLFLALW